MEGRGGIYCNRQTHEDIFGNAQTRDQGQLLIHHGNAALPGALLVGALAVDQEVSLADLLQTRDHPQRGGLTTAGGTDEHNELALLDLQIEIVHGMETIGVDFIYILQS